MRTTISIGLMINEDVLLPQVLLANHRRTHDLSLVSWEEFVHCKVKVNETCSEANRQFSDRNNDVLMNAQSLHNYCWSTLMAAVFGLSVSLIPLVGGGGGLVGGSVGNRSAG